MSARLFISMILSFVLLIQACTTQEKVDFVEFETINTGAQNFIKSKLGTLKNKKVGIVANQASMVMKTHLVDTLISHHINIARIFSPEHGFRGDAEAGASINDGIDEKTGIEIVSLYGKHKKPTSEDLRSIDIMLFDLQDVGVRFYTYISTLTYVMEACAENNIPLIVLDRPNPNGFYVDGPVLEEEYASFVGLHPVPIVYGMTIGEYAIMVNEESWLKNNVKCELTIIPLSNYKHNMIFELPVRPSPNLPNWESVYLYPSLCLFEGTIVSVGRGTEFPFQVFGHPDYHIGSYMFKPQSIPGVSENPKYKDVNCYGQNLVGYAADFKSVEGGINLKWLISSYEMLSEKHTFFSNYFEKLAGTAQLRIQIESGATEEDIKISWEKDLENFKTIRTKYLLYE